MPPKLLPLAAALILAGSAQAVTVNMTDFVFGPPATVNVVGTDGSPTYDGNAGAFAGTLSDSGPTQRGLRSLDAASSTSFVAWCAELTQSFTFGVSYDYSLVEGTTHFGSQRAGDLSRLFTAAAANHFVFEDLLVMRRYLCPTDRRTCIRQMDARIPRRKRDANVRPTVPLISDAQYLEAKPDYSKTKTECQRLFRPRRK